MSPELINLIAAFTLKLIAQFRDQPLPDEQTVANMFQLDYQNAMAANKDMVKEIEG